MAYIFDIDGTLADCSHRVHFIQPPEGLVHFEPDETDWKPDWESFYKECVNDKPVAPILELARTLQNFHATLVFVTGRPDKYMFETTEWLCDQFDTDTIILFMRKNGDHRPDYVVKKEIYDECIKDFYTIDGVFEDRKQCVDMWRSLGLTCYQVADGNY